MERFKGLAFADNICLFVQRWSDLKAKLEKLEKETGYVELKINEN
jgi:hypothetical protein